MTREINDPDKDKNGNEIDDKPDSHLPQMYHINYFVDNTAGKGYCGHGTNKYARQKCNDELFHDDSDLLWLGGYFSLAYFV